MTSNSMRPLENRFFLRHLLLLIAKSYIAIFFEVLGGHDHTEYAAKHNGCALLKAGNSGFGPSKFREAPTWDRINTLIYKMN